jgi:ABC-type amino acid transport system permease subunit
MAEHATDGTMTHDGTTTVFRLSSPAGIEWVKKNLPEAYAEMARTLPPKMEVASAQFAVLRAYAARTQSILAEDGITVVQTEVLPPAPDLILPL